MKNLKKFFEYVSTEEAPVVRQKNIPHNNRDKASFKQVLNKLESLMSDTDRLKLEKYYENKNEK